MNSWMVGDDAPAFDGRNAIASGRKDVEFRYKMSGEAGYRVEFNSPCTELGLGISIYLARAICSFHIILT